MPPTHSLPPTNECIADESEHDGQVQLAVLDGAKTPKYRQPLVQNTLQEP